LLNPVKTAYTDQMIGCWHLDEGSGTQTKDSSGLGNTGLIKGAQWSDQGVFNKALSFDGIDDCLEVDGSSFDKKHGTVQFIQKVFHKSF
jgi:hypothetical protein